MTRGLDQQKAAVASGAWPLYRFDPRLIEQGKNPLQLDSKDPTIPFTEYAYNETRFKMLTAFKPEDAKRLAKQAQEDVTSKWRLLKQMAEMNYGGQQ